MKPAIKPMLCEGYPKVFNDSGYIWERKLDGARILPIVSGTDVHLQARSGTNKTHTFPELRVETRLPAILDGEVVSAKDLSFQDSIQHRINKMNNVDAASRLYPAKLVVFDVLEIDGRNVETLPLETRKQLLQKVVVPTDTVELSDFTADGEALWQDVLANGWEGAVGKRRAGSYVRNARDWLKVKAWKRNYGKETTGETILVVGYTQGTGWRQSTFGALVLARLEADGSSIYVGEVGTGFNDAEIAHICTMFLPGVCPWTREPEPATWIKPFAIKVQYLETTNEGLLRFPSYKGMV